MTYMKNRRVRSLVVLSLVLVALFAIAGSAQAQGLVAGETVPAGTIIDNDAFLSGDNVVIDGLVDGDVLAVGRRVTINGEVTGSVIAAAELVNVNGTVGGSVYAAAATLEANESAAVDRSLYFVGAQLNSDPASTIERDLAAAALGAQLAGDVGRDVRAVVGPLALLERILDVFNIETGFQILPSAPWSPNPGPWPSPGRRSLAKTGPPWLLRPGTSLSRRGQRRPPANGFLFACASLSNSLLSAGWCPGYSRSASTAGPIPCVAGRWHPRSTDLSVSSPVLPASS